jgi:CHRD domain-containing protein
MRRITFVATAVFALVGTGIAFTDEGSRRISEFLNGYNEAAAVVSTTGNGTFRATISRDETEINYVLTFKELEGDVRQAHIHIGHPQNSGGIVLWLCDSEANPSPSATTPACTESDPLNARAGRVTGTLKETDVLAQAANGIAAGEFAEVLGLIRAGRTYVNLHTVKFPPGEIRSQIDDRDDHDRGHRDH